jgi:hypothetical protein
MGHGADSFCTFNVEASVFLGFDHSHGWLWANLKAFPSSGR